MVETRRLLADGALVWCDFDDDGGLDVVTTAIAGHTRFYRNVALLAAGIG